MPPTKKATRPASASARLGTFLQSSNIHKPLVKNAALKSRGAFNDMFAALAAGPDKQLTDEELEEIAAKAAATKIETASTTVKEVKSKLKSTPEVELRHILNTPGSIHNPRIRANFLNLVTFIPQIEAERTAEFNEFKEKVAKLKKNCEELLLQPIDEMTGGRRSRSSK